MRVFRAVPADGYELCQPFYDRDFDTIAGQVNGTTRRDSWTSPAMKLVRKDEGEILVESDSPWLGDHALIFRRAVVEALGPLLTRFGELLPLRCKGADVWMYNPTCVLDALDEEASSVVRFESSGRIMMVNQHVFRPAAIGDVDIFKVPNLRAGPTFLGPRFVRQWKRSRFKGLDFEEIWRE